MAVEALQRPALDFIEKPFRDQVLLNCVRRAFVRNREVLAVHSKRESVSAYFASLTQPKRDVLALLKTGCDIEARPEFLGLKARAIEVHRASVHCKMGARNVGQLIRLKLDGEVEAESARGPTKHEICDGALLPRENIGESAECQANARHYV